jgi:hypothetical protein
VSSYASACAELCVEAGRSAVREWRKSTNGAGVSLPPSPPHVIGIRRMALEDLRGDGVAVDADAVGLGIILGVLEVMRAEDRERRDR